MDAYRVKLSSKGIADDINDGCNDGWVADWPVVGMVCRYLMRGLASRLHMHCIAIAHPR